MRHLGTNSSKTTFQDCLSNFKLRLKARGYPINFVERSRQLTRKYCYLSLHSTQCDLKQTNNRELGVNAKSVVAVHKASEYIVLER